MTQTSKPQHQPQTPPPGQYVALNLRVKGQENGELIVEGVANDADVTDSYNSRIRFSDRALTGFMDNPICLMNHNVDNPIGTFRSVGYEGGKLKVQAVIHPDARTATGASIPDLVRSGVLKAFSVRFDEYKETRMKDYTQIDADVLDEISIVTLPSNRASLFQMRSKGIQIHGAEELLEQDGETMQTADLRSQDKTRAAGPLCLDLLTQRLRALIQAEKGESDSYYWGGAYLVAVYDDTVVWTLYTEATFWQQGYAVDAAGVVTLVGPEQEVLPSWTVVGGPDEEEDGLRTIGNISTTEVRFSPEDIAELARQIRQLSADQPGIQVALPATPEPSTETTPDPEPEITLDDVRSAIRMAAEAAIPK